MIEFDEFKEKLLLLSKEEQEIFLKEKNKQLKELTKYRKSYIYQEIEVNDVIYEKVIFDATYSTFYLISPTHYIAGRLTKSFEALMSDVEIRNKVCDERNLARKDYDELDPIEFLIQGDYVTFNY